MAGRPVHVEIGASDTRRALTFYGDLFGWQFQPFEGSPTEYHTTRFSEDTGGAIYASEGPATRVYYDVDDVRVGRERVLELGGSAEEPLPVPGMGWLATCTDPEGNAFGSFCQSPKAFPSVSVHAANQPICGTGCGSPACPPSSLTRAAPARMSSTS